MLTSTLMRDDCAINQYLNMTEEKVIYTDDIISACAIRGMYSNKEMAGDSQARGGVSDSIGINLQHIHMQPATYDTKSTLLRPEAATSGLVEAPRCRNRVVELRYDRRSLDPLDPSKCKCGLEVEKHPRSLPDEPLGEFATACVWEGVRLYDRMHRYFRGHNHKEKRRGAAVPEVRKYVEVVTSNTGGTSALEEDFVFVDAHIDGVSTAEAPKTMPSTSTAGTASSPMHTQRPPTPEAQQLSHPRTVSSSQPPAVDHHIAPLRASQQILSAVSAAPTAAPRCRNRVVELQYDKKSLDPLDPSKCKCGLEVEKHPHSLPDEPLGEFATACVWEGVRLYDKVNKYFKKKESAMEEVAVAKAAEKKLQ